MEVSRLVAMVLNFATLSPGLNPNHSGFISTLGPSDQGQVTRAELVCRVNVTTQDVNSTKGKGRWKTLQRAESQCWIVHISYGSRLQGVCLPALVYWHVVCQLSSCERFLSGFLAKLTDLWKMTDAY